MLQNRAVPIITSELTLHSRSGRVLTVLIMAIASVTEIFLLIYADAWSAIGAVAPLALLAFGAHTLFWRPLIRLSPATIEIVNPLQTFVVSWAAIHNIDTRWGLRLDTPTRAISVWASPAQSRYSSVSNIRRDSFGRADFDAEKVRGRRDGVPFSVAGLAPMLITQQWEEYRDANLLGEVEGAGVTKQWHRKTLIVLAVLGAFSVLSVVTMPSVLSALG